MKTITEHVIAWLIASMLAVGAWLLMTSFAIGANNFPVAVLTEPHVCSRQTAARLCGGEAREAHTVCDGHLAAGNSILQAGSSDVGAGIPLKKHGTGSGRLGQQPRLTACNSFLDAIERVESNGNPHAIGDKGRARGPYQFWATAWSDCSRVRSRRGESVAGYWLANDRAVARSYAATYLGMLNTYLTTALNRQPTHSEFYACWNLGPSGFKRRGFSLSRCPKSTRQAAVRINSMLAISTGGAASQGQMRIGAGMVGLASR